MPPEPPPTDREAWLRARDLFNQGEYWSVHEVLEPIWLRATGDLRSCYLGLIQLAGALHLARRRGRPIAARRPVAARRLYARALRNWARFDGEFGGLGLRWFEAEVHRALDPDAPAPRWPSL